MALKKIEKEVALIWKEFSALHDLSKEQEEKLKNYISLLFGERGKANLTAITTVEGVIYDHFVDSLMIKNFLTIDDIHAICDVGTGAGFPVVPIKIAYPHLRTFLIEVNQKKIRFLEKVIDTLGLEGIQICDLDWRTFLRKTTHKIDLFCARASLRPEELIRAFSPMCPYKNSTIVYWASIGWEPHKKIVPFIENEQEYTVKNKKRRFIFLRKP